MFQTLSIQLPLRIDTKGAHIVKVTVTLFRLHYKGVLRLDATDSLKSKVHYKFYVGTRRRRRRDHPGFRHWMRQVRSPGCHCITERGKAERDYVSLLKAFLKQPRIFFSFF